MACVSIPAAGIALEICCREGAAAVTRERTTSGVAIVEIELANAGV